MKLKFHIPSLVGNHLLLLIMTEREILKYLVLFVLLVCFVLIPRSKYIRLGLSCIRDKTWCYKAWYTRPQRYNRYLRAHEDIDHSPHSKTQYKLIILEWASLINRLST